MGLIKDYKSWNKFERNWFWFIIIWVIGFPVYPIVLFNVRPNDGVLLNILCILTFYPFWIWVHFLVKRGLERKIKEMNNKQKNNMDELSMQYGVKLSKPEGKFGHLKVNEK